MKRRIVIVRNLILLKERDKNLNLFIKKSDKINKEDVSSSNKNRSFSYKSITLSLLKESIDELIN